LGYGGLGAREAGGSGDRIDHLHRPVKISDRAKNTQWSAEYQPWGAVQSLSGPLTMNLRFPGLFCWSTFGKPMLSVVPTRSRLAL